MSPSRFPVEEYYRYGRVQALTAFQNRPKIVVGVNSQGDKYAYDESNTILASGGTAGEIAISHFQRRRARSRYDLNFILALLNHKAIEYYCRKRGSPFQHGWYARGTEVLKTMPVPIIDFDNENERKNMYNEIVRLSTSVQEIYRRIDSETSQAEQIRLTRRAEAVRNVMDGLISRLYGIENIIDAIELPTT